MFHVINVFNIQKSLGRPEMACGRLAEGSYTTGVFASKHGLTLEMGCHSMAGPFDLIPSQNLFECKPVAPHMYGEASGTMLR